MKKPKRTKCVLWLFRDGKWQRNLAAPVAGYKEVRDYANRVLKANELGSHWQWGKNVAAIVEGKRP